MPSFDADARAATLRAVSRRRLLKEILAGGTTALVSRSAVAEQPEREGALQAGVGGAHSGRMREYWLSADSFLHNVVPNGYDSMMNVTYRADQTSFMALGYRAYTPKWGAPLPGNADIGPNTGIPGPTLRAEVGDSIVIHFRNNDTHYGFPHSIHPHGVVYTPENDGAWTGIDPHKPGTAVKVGETFTYTYTVAPTCVGTWFYHDHSVPQSIGPAAPDPELGEYLGLFGLFAITDHTTPKVDREHVLFFHDLYAANIPSLVQDFDCFNGRSFVENTPTFQARVGETVRWRVAALGREFHVFHLHGHRWLYNGHPTDAVVFGPAAALTIEYVEDNTRKWLYHCHVSDHMMGGMLGRYVVTP
jgi:FtsP/CotA-like multicopper oxidase with cupredoxin domain